MAKHSGRPERTTPKWVRPAAITLAIPLTLIGLWYCPDNLLPVTKTSSECEVTRTDFGHVYTTDCGTLYYRGNPKTPKGRALVMRTGPVAWELTPIETTS